MQTGFTLRLREISYMGSNVGNDWEFSLTIGDTTTTFPALISLGEMRVFNKLLFEGSGDTDSPQINLPVSIGARERDPSQDDSGSSSGILRVDLSKTAQTFQLTVGVLEARKKSTSTMEAMLVFTFAVETGATTLRIDTITPGRGPLSGGTAVTITGEGFLNGSQVYFGKTPAASVEFADEKTLKAISPEYDDAGAVTITVETPAGSSAKLRNAFLYEGKPEITYVDPNEGPVTPDEEQPFFVFIYGKNFQDNAIVFFGDVPAKTVQVADDGARIKVALPAAEMPGVVDVRLENPDGTKARKEKAFNYLAKDELGRARIRKFSPLQLIDGQDATVVVTGRRLKEAYEERLFCLHAPDTIDLIMGDVTPGKDKETGEDTLTFTLTAKSRSILLYTSRTMIQFLVSVREQAEFDLIAEDSDKFLTLLPARFPVALAYTSEIGAGKTQMLMVAGRNLQGSTLKLRGSKGLEMLESHSEDKVSVLMVRVTDPSLVVPGSLELIDVTGRTSKYPLQMGTLQPQEPAGEEPSIGRLTQVPGQRVIPPQKGRSIAWQLRTKSPLKRSDPKFEDNKNLIVDFKFTIATFELVIPVLDDIVFFNVADRGGDEILGKGLDLSVGRVLRVRNLDFIVALQVNLVVKAEVFLFLFSNPFVDFNSDAPFDAFAPFTPPDTFGSVVTSLEVKISFEFRILFFAALVLPPVFNPEVFDPLHPERFPEILNPLRPEGLRMQVVAVFLLDFEIRNTSLGAELRLGGGVYVRVVLPLYKYAAKITTYQSDGLQLLAPYAFPDPAGLGLVAYFFAREKGKYCFEWERDGIQPKLGFLSSGEEVDLQDVPDTQFCLEVQENKELYVFNPIPKQPVVETNASQLLWVYRARINPDDPNKREMIDYKNVPDPSTYEILSSDTSILLPVRDECTEKQARVKDWILFGKKPGTVQLSIKADLNKRESVPGTIPAARTAFLPTDDITFDLFPNILLGLFPDIIMPLKNEGDSLVEVSVTDPTDSTIALKAQRNLLWQDYVQQTTGEKNPDVAKAWDALTCSAKAVFLINSHRLFYSSFSYMVEDGDEFLLSLDGETIAEQVKSIIELRGSLDDNCNNPEANRMFVRINKLAAYGLEKLTQNPDPNTLRIFDNAGNSYPGKPGKQSWRRIRRPSGSLYAIETPPDRLPKTRALLLDEPDYPTIAPTTQDTELPTIAEVVTNFGDSNCTEVFGDARVLFSRDQKNYPATGRRMYDYYYGSNITPVDFGWSPQPVMVNGYVRNVEEVRGAKGVEDEFIALDDAGRLNGFPPMAIIVEDFEIGLLSVRITDPNAGRKLLEKVNTGGKNILQRARLTANQSSYKNPDDRPLYWARLKMTVLIKSHPFMLSAPESRRQEILRAFETASRGYDDLVFTPGKNTLRVVVTGFDPFELDDNIKASNPSAAVALALHSLRFGLTNIPANVEIRSVIFPVRRRDFDQDGGKGVVEATLESLIRETDENTQLSLVLTTSQGEEPDDTDKRGKFELDRFAGRKRGIRPDNEGVQGAGIKFPDPVPGDEFYECFLPVKSIVPADSNRPDFKFLYVNRFNYSYMLENVQMFAFCDYIPEGNENIEDRKDADKDLFKGMVPSALDSFSTPRKEDITCNNGSGGVFLSNEIFYRVSRLRNVLKRIGMFNGHFHLPRIQKAGDDFNPGETRLIINEVINSIRRIFS